MGGLIAQNVNNGRIAASYSRAEVVGDDVPDFARLGGLVGYNAATLEACYATGNVTSTSRTEFHRGGLVGENNVSITACYSTGTVTISGTGGKGGLVGDNTGGTITNSYYDYDMSNIGGGIGLKRTTELQSPIDYSGIFAAWNLDIDDGVNPGLEDGSAAGDAGTDSPWDFGTDSEHPALSIDFDGDGVASAYEFGVQERPRPPLPNLLNPNLIDVGSFEQLNAIRFDLDGDGEVDDDANATAYSDAFGIPSCAGSCEGYELTTDLDLAPNLADAGETWAPIGDDSDKFDATFNGNGYTISNLSVSVSADDVGMFGFIEEEGVIRNLGLEKVSVTNTKEGRSVNTGGLVGDNVGLIVGCYVTGTVTGSGSSGRISR